MATRYSRQSDNRPPVDEWGIYDPSQAGLEALYGKLLARRPMAEPDGRRMAASMDDVKRMAKRSSSKKV